MRLKDLKNLRNTYCGDEYYTEYTRHTIFASDDHNSVIIELEDGQIFNLEDLGFTPTSFKLQDGQEFDSSKLAFTPTKIVVEAITRIITPDDSGDQKPQTTVYQ